MNMQWHCMAAVDEDQRRNYVHKYTTGLHPRHPLLYTAVNQKFQGKSVQGPKQSKQNKQKIYSIENCTTKFRPGRNFQIYKS